MYRIHILSFLLCGIATSVLISGCGGGGPTRYGITGKVTVDGTPVDNGTIAFMSTGDGPPESAHGTITNGEYSIPADRGPQSGTFKVMIYSPKPTGKEIVDTDTGNMIPVTEESIPKKYNEETTLTIEVDGKKAYDFELSTAN